VSSIASLRCGYWSRPGASSLWSVGCRAIPFPVQSVCFPPDIMMRGLHSELSGWKTPKIEPDCKSPAAQAACVLIAIGDPFGLGDSVTAGIVSAEHRVIGAGRFDDFMQIDAPIDHGNSGGPTFDLEGKVIGVNTAINSPTGGKRRHRLCDPVGSGAAGRTGPAPLHSWRAVAPERRWPTRLASVPAGAVPNAGRRRAHHSSGLGQVLRVLQDRSTTLSTFRGLPHVPPATTGCSALPRCVESGRDNPIPRRFRQKPERNFN
jgi:hypothetical protein